MTRGAGVLMLARLSAPAGAPSAMFERGYLQIGRIHGIPLRIHWTMPLGALVFSGFAFAPAFWVGFFVVVLVHELGHALLARRYRQHVLSIDITGFGGLTRFAGSATRRQHAVIAWGGVLAQALLLAVTFAVVLVAGPPRSWILAQLVAVFTTANLWIIGLNLLPFPPLDGATAWPLVGEMFRRWRDRGGRGPGRGSSARSARPRWPRARSPRGNGAPPRRPTGAAPDRDLADTLRRIAEQAGEARRGSSRR